MSPSGELFDRADRRQCWNCIEKQPSGKIGEPLGGDAFQPFHHFRVRDRASVEHHLAGDLAGTRRRAFLAHQQLGADLGAGAVDFLLVNGFRRLAQLVEDDGHQRRQLVAAGRRMDAEDAGIGKTPVEGIDRIAETAMFAHFLEQARRHAAAENVGKDLRTVEVAHVIGLALETEQDLRVHQVAGFAHVAADIAGGFEHGRRARRHRQAGETLFHLFGEGRMIDGAGRDHEHPVRRVIARKIVADLARREALDRFRRAEDRPAERLAEIGDLGKLVEHHVVGRVVGGADLLQDDVLFAAQLFLVEGRFRQDVGEDIDRERHMVLEHAGVIGGGFGRGCGIQLAADILDFLGDVASAAAGGALEGHVLEEVGDPVFVLGLVA